MRIIARGWHKRQHKMYSPEEMAADQLALLPDGSGFWNISGVSAKLSEHITEMLPLLYTGKVDQNGKRIFDGDILQSIDSGITCLVAYDEKYLQWRALDKTHSISIAQSRWNERAVIGNRFENPELWEA